MIGTRAIQEFLTVNQPEKVSVPSRRSSVPRLCGVFKRHLHGRRKNRGSQAMA